jgi:SAM-dependent methyltransferase
LRAAAVFPPVLKRPAHQQKGIQHETDLHEPTVVPAANWGDGAHRPDAWRHSRARLRARRAERLHLGRHALVPKIHSGSRPHRRVSREALPGAGAGVPVSHVEPEEEATARLALTFDAVRGMPRRGDAVHSCVGAYPFQKTDAHLRVKARGRHFPGYALMDRLTLAAYDSAAAAFAQDWHAQPPPDDVHAIFRKYFKPGLTADIGCGSGREAAWLAAHGLAAIGYDASAGLLKEARTRYPQLEFKIATLPDLTGIDDDAFDNVLCETVIMHLERAAIAPSVRRLLTILKPGGILYLSWRASPSDQRDAHGRLYAAFSKDLILRELAATAILLDEEVVSAPSGKTVHRIVAKKAEACVRA